MGQDYSVTWPETVFTPQTLTFIRDKLIYCKSYHPVEKKESNKNGNFEKGIDLSEHIS